MEMSNGVEIWEGGRGRRSSLGRFGTRSVEEFPLVNSSQLSKWHTTTLDNVKEKFSKDGSKDFLSGQINSLRAVYIYDDFPFYSSI